MGSIGGTEIVDCLCTIRKCHAPVELLKANVEKIEYLLEALAEKKIQGIPGSPV